MSRVIRAAVFQTAWTGDKESMIQVHEQAVRDAAAQGAQVLCFQELFYGPYFCQVQDQAVLRVRRADPRRPDRPALPGARQGTGHRPGAADVRGGAARRPLQHRRRDRRGRLVPRQVPQAPHPAGATASGRSSTSAPGTPAGPSSTRPSAGSASTSATTGTSRRAGGRWASRAPRSSSTRRPPHAVCPRYLWQLEQPAAAVANEYFVGAINRVGVEELGDNDFYGTSYFVDPEAQFVGEVASDKETELVVRDLDMAKLREVRDRWQFYRDRRPGRLRPADRSVVDRRPPPVRLLTGRRNRRRPPPTRTGHVQCMNTEGEGA